MSDVAQISDLQTLFGNLVSALMALAGIVLFVLIVSSGFKYITSGGDPKAVEGAKKTITYAVFGLVAIIFSYIALILIERVTGLTPGTLTKFRLSIQ